MGVTSRLVYDPTDAETIAASSTIGAYTLDGSGNPILSTNGALHVNIAEGDFELNTKIDGDYDGTTNPTPDSAGVIFHDRTASPDGTAQNQRPTAGLSSLSLDLSTVHDQDVAAGFYAYDPDSTERKAVQWYNEAARVSDICQDSFLVTQKDVAATAGALLASQLADRKKFLIQNLGNKEVWLGGASVTVGTGFMLPPSSTYEFNLGDAIDLYAISTAGTQDCRIMEVA
jgi:hypothetical protein